MLLGLLGVSLPILAHLLSRRKYDVVDWGAMQFLELGRKTRRRIRLEELLLLLLRMLMIGLIAFALARPWVSGGLIGQVGSSQSRDVVLVIDGSYSMGWKAAGETPHSRAITQALAFIDTLNTGDTVSVLDARDQIRGVIDPPTSDLSQVRDAIASLPAPSGTTNLGRAITKATQILTATRNVAREIVVLTDGQKQGWDVDQESTWTRLESLVEMTVIKPRIWVMDVSVPNQPPPVNVGLDQIQLARELVVPDFPVRLRTRLMATGHAAATTQTVFLAVDGTRVPGKVARVQVEPNGDATVELEHRLTAPGPHLLALLLDEDGLPGDDAAYFAVQVTEAVPVLIVDGDPHVKPVESESFFARLAFTAPGNPTPWVKASVIPWSRLSSVDVNAFEVVVLANVPRLDPLQVTELERYTKAGGGLLVALGDQVDVKAYNKLLFANGQGLLPAQLERIAPLGSNDQESVSIRSSSLDLPWLESFREGVGVDLVRAGFQRIWQLQSLEPEPDQPQRSPATVAIRLESNDPLLLVSGFGRGNVALMTTPLDADWSTLPAKRDFVPFLHELVFYLASNRAALNVPAGTPLTISRQTPEETAQLRFERPDGELVSPLVEDRDGRQLVRLADTSLSGSYRLIGDGDSNQPIASFVARDDRSESDLTRLEESDLATLQENDRMQFTDDLDELTWEMFRDESRSELWQLMLLVFLGMLCFEVWMTRRLVLGGHQSAGPVPDESSEADDNNEVEFADEMLWEPSAMLPIEEEVRRRKSQSGWKMSELD